MSGEGKQSPMIRSQSFSEPIPLDCEFHENLSFFPRLLGEAEWLEGAEIEHFPSLLTLQPPHPPVGSDISAD